MRKSVQGQKFFSKKSEFSEQNSHSFVPLFTKLTIGLFLILSFGGLAFAAPILAPGLFSNNKNQPQLATNQQTDRAVLAATSQKLFGKISFNIPAFFTDTATFEQATTFNGKATFNNDIQITNHNLDLGTGQLTASNVVYSVTAGNGITVTGGQRPVVSNTGVLSVQGQTGAVSLLAGTGISFNGLTVNNTGVTSFQGQSGSVTLTAGTGISISGTTISSSGGGGGGNSFGNITVGSTTIAATAATDTVTFAAGTGVTLTPDATNKKLTFATTGSAFSGITSGTNTSAAMIVGSGASLDFTGTGTINASTLLGNTWAAPAAIGSGTANTGAFTTLTGTTVNALTLTSNADGFGISGGTTSRSLTVTGSNITLTGGGNTLTMTGNASLNQNVLTTSSPTFAGLTISGFNAHNAVVYATAGTGVLGIASTTTSNLCLTSAGTNIPTWASCTGGSGATNYWQLNTGALSPADFTNDLLVGGAATASAKFQIFGGTGNATTSGNLTFNTSGQIQTTNNQTLTIGSSSTGNIVLSGFATGVLHSTSGVLSSSAVALGGSEVTGTLLAANGGTGISSYTIGDLIYASGATTLSKLADVSTGSCLVSGGIGTAPSWSSCSSSSGNLWTSSSGAIYPVNSTEDLLVGGTATSSAKFAVLNVNSGTPTASVSAGAAGAAYISANGTLATTAKQSLTFGDTNTGNIVLNGFATGIIHSTSGVLSSSAVALGSSDVSGTLTVGNGGTGITSYTIGDLIYASGATALSKLADVSTGSCLVSGGIGAAPSWSSCSTSSGNLWTSSSGAIYPVNSTEDLLIGGTATSSAKFAFINVNSGTPTASVSAGAAGGVYLSATGTIATTTKQTLTIGDTNTGNVIFSQSGNVGIGTTNPISSKLLTISNVTSPAIGAGATGVAVVVNGGGGYYVKNNSDGCEGKYESFSGTIGIGSNSSCAFTLHVNGNEQARFDLNGNFGFHTTSPLATLDVRANSGTLAIASVSGATSFASLVVDNSGVGDIFTASSSGLNRFVITQNGNVGIGTTTPGNLLQIAGAIGIQNSNTITGVSNYTEFNNGISVGGATTYNISNAGVGTFATGSNVTSNGATYFQIGSTGGSGSFGRIYVDLQRNGDFALTDGNANSYWYNYGGTSVTGIPQGATGIGLNVTSPHATLDVEGGNSGGNAALLVNQNGATTNDIFAASASGTTKFVINNSGNVGIGVTTPTSFALQIAGNIGPNATTTYDLGSTTDLWNHVYSKWLINSAGLSVGTTLQVGTNGTQPIATIAAKTSFAALVVDNSGVGPIFSASSSGVSQFTIANNGVLTDAAYGTGIAHFSSAGILSSSAVALGSSDVTGVLPLANGGTNANLTAVQGGIIYSGASAFAISAAGTSGQCLLSGGTGTPTWGSCTTGGGTNYWTSTLGALYPVNSTMDLLIGGTATSSAKFAFINNNTGSPTASISGNLSMVVPTGSNPAETFNTLNGGSLNFQTSVGGDAGLTSRMFIGNNGNVGLGNSNPAEKLQLTAGNIELDNNQYLAFKDSGGSERAALQWTNADNLELQNGATGGNIILQLTNAAGTGKIQFLTKNTERMRIDTNGNVGIGTTAPIATLDLRSNIGTLSVASISGATSLASLVVDNSGVGDIFTASSSGLSRFVITQAGNVGIGLTQPGTPLDISYNLTSSAFGIRIQNTAASNYSMMQFHGTGHDFQVGVGNASESFYGVANKYFVFDNNAGAMRLVIDTAGSLGLGTTSPLATFDVRGNSGTTPIASLSAKTSFAGLVVDNSGTGDLFTASSSGLNRFVITQAGNVGIGMTNPAAVLHVKNQSTASNTWVEAMRLESNNSGAGAGAFIHFADAATGDMAQFGAVDITNFGGGLAFATKLADGNAGTLPTERMRLDANGSLGIGTTSPLGTLDVRNDVGTLPTASLSGKTSFAALVVDNSTGPLFSASSSGVTQFTIANNGILTDVAYGTGIAHFSSAGLISSSAVALGGTDVSGTLGVGNGGTGIASYTTGDLLYASGATTLSKLADVATGSCLVSGGVSTAPNWGSCSAASHWQENSGALAPVNVTDDLLIGSAATSSAVFQVFGTTSGTTPAGSASMSGNLNFIASGGTAHINRLNGGSLDIQTSVGGNAGLTSRFMVLNNGNVGVGTTTPTALFDVLGAASVSGSLSFRTGAGTIQTTANNTLTLGGGSTGNIILEPLNGSGNVGIGTATPQANLDVSGNTSGTIFANITNLNTAGTTLLNFPETNGGFPFFIKRYNSTNANANLVDIWNAQTAAGSDTRFGVGNQERVRFTSTGLVGVNVTAPSALLDIRGVGINTLSGIIPIASFSGKTSFAGLVVDNSGLGDIFAASSSGLNRFVITQAGNVGIGITNPAGPLDVRLPGNTTGTIALFGNGTTGSYGLIGNSNATGSPFRILGSTNDDLTLGANGTDIVRILGNVNGNSPIGAVGFGTSTPLARIDAQAVNGILPVASISGKTSFAAMVVDNSGTGDIFTASSSGKARFTIQQSGVVLIGDTTNGLTFDYVNGGPTYAGTARPTKQITLSPEYAGAILSASGSATTNGQMTSDASPSANFRTYYNWTSSQTSLQDYTIAVRVTLPKDFSAWATSGNALAIDMNTPLTTTTANKLDVILYNPTFSASTPVLYDQAEVSTSQKTWKTIGYANTLLANWATAGQTATIYLKVYSKDNQYVQVGDIVLNYLAKF